MSITHEDLNADQLAATLLQGIYRGICHDPTWQMFGFSRTPWLGPLFNIFMSKERLDLERFLLWEFATLGTTITVQSIVSNVHPDRHLQLVPFILHSQLEVFQRSHKMKLDIDYLTYFSNGTLSYLEEPELSWNELFLIRGPRLINKKRAARFFLGSAWIMNPQRSIFPALVLSSRSATSRMNNPSGCLSSLLSIPREIYPVAEDIIMKARQRSAQT